MEEFRGILILDKKDRPPAPTLTALRKAGYVVLFLDNIDHYRITNHVALDLSGGAKILLKEFSNSAGTATKTDILYRFGFQIAKEIIDSSNS